MKKDRKFLERVAWYAFGVAIGLLLLGFIQMKRSQTLQPRHATAPAQPTGEPSDP